MILYLVAGLALTTWWLTRGLNEAAFPLAVILWPLFLVLFWLAGPVTKEEEQQRLLDDPVLDFLAYVPDPDGKIAELKQWWTDEQWKAKRRKEIEAAGGEKAYRLLTAKRQFEATKAQLEIILDKDYPSGKDVYRAEMLMRKLEAELKNIDRAKLIHYPH